MPLKLFHCRFEESTLFTLKVRAAVEGCTIQDLLRRIVEKDLLEYDRPIEALLAELYRKEAAKNGPIQQTETR